MVENNELIAPHGGTLIDLMITDEAKRYDLVEKAKVIPKWELDERGLADLECIATGVYSPLTGFAVEADYVSILKSMRLSTGLIWPIPITLQVTEDFAAQLKEGSEISLTKEDSHLAILKISSIYRPDKAEEAGSVYGTDDKAHPGVAALNNGGPVYLGGDIQVFADIPHIDFFEYRFTPKMTRKVFTEKGWKTVVAFQTRNPIHRAHEHLQKVAMESVDGLFVNPLVGATKSDDIPSHVRMETYNVILNNYYPKNRVFLGVYPANMRYAGPKEAILHAISRQNYGCSHMIIGRDHAGVGKYYGTYDAQLIFDQFAKVDLLIKPLKFEHAFYCKLCEQMVTKRTCPHSKEAHVFLSGTRVREMLQNNEMLPREFTRPEVAMILIDAVNNNRRQIQQKGVSMLFTGLSGAGKTTISKALAKELKKRGYKVERLDADIVRQNLSKGLGFSKEDRDENIRRVGFVCHLMSRNGVIAMMANIAPYVSVREEIRQRIGDFMEVYVNASLEACEERDLKGLYAKARAGEIKGFTGIDDPYEEPQAPEVVCNTDDETVEESVQKVLDKMEELGYIKPIKIYDPL
ncbi:MAG: sulfate adenylyltransferase [Candidatus Heimdallarchaeota archaeon]|nr:sulfate adenylyltransferase [Candidatus Heimdallarchaeota archaeon]